jgi:hypothetical protein
MSRVNLLDGVVFTPTITENGKHILYQSDVQTNSNGDNSLKVLVEYLDNLPDSDNQLTAYGITCIIEEDDSAGNWYPVMYQYAPFTRTGSGRHQVLTMQPNTFNLDEGVPYFISDGYDIIGAESRKQATLGEDFRIILCLHEERHGETGAFQSVKVNLAYEKYSV